MKQLLSDDKRFELGTNLYYGDVIHPNGYQYLESFTKDFFPEWIYEVGGIQVEENHCDDPWRKYSGHYI